MRPALAALALLLALPATLAAGPPQEFVGTLEPEAVPDRVFYLPLELAPAPAGTEKELPAPPAEGDRLFSGSLAWSKDKERDARVVLVVPAQGKHFLYADTDLDGKLSAAERFPFTDEEEGSAGLLLRFRPQATPESVEEVALRSFGVLEIPAALLLDPEGRIVSTGLPNGAGLRGEKLMKTLEDLLPKPAAGR